IGLKFNERSSLEDFFIRHLETSMLKDLEKFYLLGKNKDSDLDSMTVLLPIHGLADDDSTFHVTGSIGCTDISVLHLVYWTLSGY
ncbi:hypothetical protein Tco_1489610, partial [Tanacetum coccineum]